MGKSVRSKVKKRLRSLKRRYLEEGNKERRVGDIILTMRLKREPIFFIGLCKTIRESV